MEIMENPNDKNALPGQSGRKENTEQAGSESKNKGQSENEPEGAHDKYDESDTSPWPTNEETDEIIKEGND